MAATDGARSERSKSADQPPAESLSPGKDAPMRNRSRRRLPTPHHHRCTLRHDTPPEAAGSDPNGRILDRTFLARWLDELDPLLRTWLLASIEREVRDRTAAELLTGTEREAEAVDLLVNACAEAHDLTGRELRWLVPAIEGECRALLRGTRERFSA